MWKDFEFGKYDVVQTILEQCYQAKVVAAGTTSNLKAVPSESKKLSIA